MLGTIILKELRSILLSPKFAVTFAACTILMLLSVGVGIRDYQAGVEQYQAALKLTGQSAVEQSWNSFSTRAYREPDPMRILVSGVQNDLGRFSRIARSEEVKLRQSTYSDESIFAVFRFVDFTFIVQMVLSLFAILFTYDAVNGEREGGTLQLTFSNPLPRARFILGKFTGAWLGLVVPLSIPVLVSGLLLKLAKVPLTADHWSKLGVLLGLSLLFFSFFICFGVLVSTMSRSSSVSFLYSLVAWVCLVLIAPRASVMLAGQVVQVPSVGEIESRQAGFAQESWDRHNAAAQERWRERTSLGASLDAQSRRALNQDKMAEWLKEENDARNRVLAAIAEYSRKLNEERRNLAASQERLALLLSRFSPASAYQLAAMNLAGTDIHLKNREEDSMQGYREELMNLSAKKSEEQGTNLGNRMVFSSSSQGGQGPRFQFSFAGGDRPTLDVSEVPAYESPRLALKSSVAPTVVDFGILSLYSLGSFAGAFLLFLRYDVR